jgi:pimeloyl-ACP methyl ester carboxylesterase
VLYPRYEPAHRPDALRHLVAGIRAGAARLEKAGLPVFVIGYSRGARLGVEYAAVARAAGLIPKAVLSLFPSTLVPGEPLVDLRGIDPGTRIVILVATGIRVVGQVGAQELRVRLDQAGYPRRRTPVEFVRSRRGFTATHQSVLETTPGARAAYWARADRLIAALTSVR